jgi:RimJ/RimL family protein N-acetyltransferase
MADLHVRPFDCAEDYHAMIDYFLGLTQADTQLMGIDPAKLPARTEWFESAWRDHQLSNDDPRRDRFYIGFVMGGQLIGHSSINHITWGRQANGHLHLWAPRVRRRGLGSECFRQAVSAYFERFELQTLIVEPHAQNPAPNRVVEKLGFRFVRKYRGVPGQINVEQEINRWEMDRDTWRET